MRNAVTLLTAVNEINLARTEQAVALVEEAIGRVSGKQVAVWGATFKPGTDDVRDSAALLIADRLHSLGATVTVYDPMGSGNALASYPEFNYAESAVAAASDADVIVVLTAWPEFAQANPSEIAEFARGTVVVDACQGINVTNWQNAGWRVSSLTGLWDVGPALQAGKGGGLRFGCALGIEVRYPEVFAEYERGSRRTRRGLETISTGCTSYLAAGLPRFVAPPSRRRWHPHPQSS